MSIPNIYDLTNFNKKTHNIIVNIRYNESENHLEITHDGITITDTNFTKKNKIFYNINNSSVCMDLLKQRMYGFYQKIDDRFDTIRWKSINLDCIINFDYNVDIYFYKSNIPPFYEILNRDDELIFPFVSCGYHSKIPFIIFSDDIIDPVPYFDLNKMKYIKQYIHIIPGTELKLVYMIYKFHNMIFIFNSHIIENDRKERFTYWDEKEKCFHCDLESVPQDVYYCDGVDFTPVIGKYEHRLFYCYTGRY